MWIRGSTSGNSGSGFEIYLKSKKKSNLFLLNFFLYTYVLLSFMSLFFLCIKQKSDFLKKMIFLLFWLNFMRVYHCLFLLPGSGSKFPEVDPDPANWYTGKNRKYQFPTSLVCFKFLFLGCDRREHLPGADRHPVQGGVQDEEGGGLGHYQRFLRRHRRANQVSRHLEYSGLKWINSCWALVEKT